ncbi:protein asteroid homolog 1-like [Salmo salar]|uniref:Protein asteroid homolog 1-like n=1 Tax=Salmo salar TaxID=8030 RepID=A0ABM3EW57_SALSA|nr:protein asteroid homolog 1-like [Salmo salar]
MVGNDNVYFGITWEDNEDKPRVGSKVRQAEERFPTLERILKWLASVQEKKKALELMPSLIGDKNADVVSRGMIDYDIPETLPSYLEGFFSNDVAPGLDCLPTPLRVLPDWTLLLLMKGKLPSRIVNVLLHKRVMQSAQVENHALVSGNTTSQFIRQVLYGLLLLGSSPVKEHDRKGKNLRTDGRKADPSSQKVSEVKEYDREGTELTYRMVKAILPSAAQHLQLDTLDKAPHSVRLEVFLETLRCVPVHFEWYPTSSGTSCGCYLLLAEARPSPTRPSSPAGPATRTGLWRVLQREEVPGSGGRGTRVGEAERADSESCRS